MTLIFTSLSRPYYPTNTSKALQGLLSALTWPLLLSWHAFRASSTLHARRPLMARFAFWSSGSIVPLDVDRRTAEMGIVALADLRADPSAGQQTAIYPGFTLRALQFVFSFRRSLPVLHPVFGVLFTSYFAVYSSSIRIRTWGLRFASYTW